MARPLTIGLLLALLLAACAPGPEPTAVPSSPSAGGEGLVQVALMPLEDLGEETGGVFQVQGLLEKGLAERGYGLADQAGLKRLLLRERVRRSGSVGRELGRQIGQELGAPLILIGAVTQYRTGLDPCVSVVARLVEAGSGRIVWTGAASSTGGQHETVLGLGRIQDASRLAELVVADLLSGLPPASAAQASLAGREVGP